MHHKLIPPPLPLTPLTPSLSPSLARSLAPSPQENQVNELIRDKDDLAAERDLQVQQIADLRQEINDYLGAARAKEAERLAAGQVTTRPSDALARSLSLSLSLLCPPLSSFLSSAVPSPLVVSPFAPTSPVEQLAPPTRNADPSPQFGPRTSQEISSLKEIIATRRAEADRELRRRERLEKEAKVVTPPHHALSPTRPISPAPPLAQPGLPNQPAPPVAACCRALLSLPLARVVWQDLKHLIANRDTILKTRNSQLATSDANVSRVEEQLERQRKITDKATRELELTKQRVAEKEAANAAQQVPPPPNPLPA